MIADISLDDSQINETGLLDRRDVLCIVGRDHVDVPHSRNSAIRTLRRMLGKARDWKLLREVPRIKTLKVFPRDRLVSLEDEKRLLSAAKQPLQNVLTIMLDSGLRNGEVIRMRWENVHWESISTPRAKRARLAGTCH